MAKVRLAVLVSVSLLMSSVVGAAPLIGKFTTTGLGDVRVGLNFIDWGQVGDVFGPTNGDIMFITATDSFASLALTNGTLKDLNSAVDPVGTPISVDNFLTANTQPTWNFALKFIEPGSGTAAGCTTVVGAVCTPFVGSPFTITNLAGGGSSVALALNGTVSDGIGPATMFVGTFTTQFANLNAAELLALVNSQGFVQSSHSAEFTVTAVPTTVPEPATLTLLGSGLLASVFLRRRRDRRPTS